MIASLCNVLTYAFDLIVDIFRVKRSKKSSIVRDFALH